MVYRRDLHLRHQRGDKQPPIFHFYSLQALATSVHKVERTIGRILDRGASIFDRFAILETNIPSAE